MTQANEINEINEINEFFTIGQDLFAGGLNNSHSGNISLRWGENLLITRTGSMLHRLSGSDIIKTSLTKDDEASHLASSELIVHRAIYAGTNANAIVHAHLPCVVALTLGDCSRFTPTDAEGQFYFKNGVAVLRVKNAIASSEVAEQIAPLLKEAKAVVVQAHGVFAVGSRLNEAYHWLTSLEHSAKIMLLNKLYNRA